MSYFDLKSGIVNAKKMLNKSVQKILRLEVFKPPDRPIVGKFRIELK